MHLSRLLSVLGFLTALANGVAAALPSSNHGFGGVNHHSLQHLDPGERNKVITALVDADVSAIRLFLRPDATHPDLEPELGKYDDSVLDAFDDTLAAIHRISKGRTKVIIAPHDVHALRGSNKVACDAYCKAVGGEGGAWLDFYVKEENSKAYHNRLTHIFNTYKSKNFKGNSWGTLNQVIMGVDLQSEPFLGLYPIPFGGYWLCETATHLKKKVGLGKSNIAVITGGISGGQNAWEDQNFPHWVLGKCDTIDVIGINGFHAAASNGSAGAAWSQIFTPNNTLVGGTIGSKLLLVESLNFVAGPGGREAKHADVWDQINTLNFRGIPWMYSSIVQGTEKHDSDVNIFATGKKTTMSMLKPLFSRASTSPSAYNWSKYVPKSKRAPFKTEVSVNPHAAQQGTCKFGCLGWLCDSPDGCDVNFVCLNNMCQECKYGCPGEDCHGRRPCQEHLRCSKGKCQACSTRKTSPSKPDTCPSSILEQPLDVCKFCDKRVSNCRGAPCVRSRDCDTSEECYFGLCRKCTTGCLGQTCERATDCKQGYCNHLKKCDYPVIRKLDPNMMRTYGHRGPRAFRHGIPQDMFLNEQGANKVRDVPIRNNIKDPRMEGPKPTGRS